MVQTSFDCQTLDFERYSSSHSWDAKKRKHGSN